MATQLTILGLDTSTKTGFAVLALDYDGTIDKAASGVITSKLKGFDRWADMASQMMSLLDKYCPDMVVIEGYGFANKHTLVTLVEVGTVLRYFLWQCDVPYVEIPPTSLKKFVTGKGNCKKELIIKEIYKRWRHDISSNDEADAIGLAYFGMAIHRINVDLPKKHLEAVSKFLKEK